MGLYVKSDGWLDTSGDPDSPLVHSRTPNISTGTLDPRYIVIHYTAGRDFNSSVRWLCDRRAKASAHLVIGRDGQVAQLAGFDQITWHAGRSSWAGIEGLNLFSIGIELDNPGLLESRANGSLRTWFGATWLDDSAIWARHKHWPNAQPFAHWASYTDKQLARCEQICELLVERFPRIEDILGHDDIAPGRKIDPGPAFPMDQFRSHLFGRRGEAGDDAN